MVRHRYRVTRRLPWIEGGRPGPRGTWIGGQFVIYPPGARIALTDRDVIAIYHCLEAIDTGGGAALDRAREAMEAPAETTNADFCPKDRRWLIRVITDKLRTQGCFQDLVVSMLECGVHPPRADLIAAFEANVPTPQAIRDYLVMTYLLATPGRRPGPSTPTFSTGDVLAISASYEYELMRARRTHTHDSRAARTFAAVAKQATAPVFGLTKRTLERVLAQRPSHRERPV